MTTISKTTSPCSCGNELLRPGPRRRFPLAALALLLLAHGSRAGGIESRGAAIVSPGAWNGHAIFPAAPVKPAGPGTPVPKKHSLPRRRGAIATPAGSLFQEPRRLPGPRLPAAAGLLAKPAPGPKPGRFPVPGKTSVRPGAPVPARPRSASLADFGLLDFLHLTTTDLLRGSPAGTGGSSISRASAYGRATPSKPAPEKRSFFSGAPLSVIEDPARNRRIPVQPGSVVQFRGRSFLVLGREPGFLLLRDRKTKKLLRLPRGPGGAAVYRFRPLPAPSPPPGGGTGLAPLAAPHSTFPPGMGQAKTFNQ